MGKCIFIPLAEGFEEVEALTLVDVLRRAEQKVTTLSITDSLEVTAAHGVCVKADDLLIRHKDATPDALVLPGGMPGTKNLLDCLELKEMIQRLNHQEGVLLGAICAAPWVLAEAGVLDNRAATCYPGFEDKLKNAHFLNERVVVDRGIVTSRGVGTAMNFALKLVEILCGEEVALNLAHSMVFSGAISERN